MRTPVTPAVVTTVHESAMRQHPMSAVVQTALVQALAGSAVVVTTPADGGVARLALACALAAREGIPVTLVGGGGELSRAPVRTPNTWGIWNYSDWDAFAAVVPELFEHGKQHRTAYSRFVVRREQFDAFLAAYLPAVHGVRVGHPLAVERPDDPCPRLDFGPMISAAGAEELRAHVADAVDRGAVPLYRGRTADARFLPGQDTSAYVQPVTLLGPPPSSPPHHAAPCGPVDTVVLADTETDLLAAMNAPDGVPPVATLCTDDTETFHRLAPRIRAGEVGHNEPRPCRIRGALTTHAYTESDRL